MKWYKTVQNLGEVVPEIEEVDGEISLDRLSIIIGNHHHMIRSEHVNYFKTWKEAYKFIKAEQEAIVINRECYLTEARDQLNKARKRLNEISILARGN